MIRLEIALMNALARAKGALLTVYLRLHGCVVGKNLKCKQWPIFRVPPQGNMSLGDNIVVGYGITFILENTGTVTIGHRVILTHNVLISAAESITIGDSTMVGENVSVRDADHGTKADIEIYKQKQASTPVLIGRDVWLGAGTVVLKGAHIRDGVVIGANSVVTSSTTTDSYCIYTGSPIKFLRKRK